MIVYQYRLNCSPRALEVAAAVPEASGEGLETAAPASQEMAKTAEDTVSRPEGSKRSYEESFIMSLTLTNCRQRGLCMITSL